MKKRGKLIVIDGADGSGKTTQAKLLVEFLQKNKIPAKYIHFPRYEEFYGDVTARFLRGEFGDATHMSSYLIALPFAMDRLHAKVEINKYLKQGTIVVLDAYATTNMAHQGTRFDTPEKRDEYLEWQYTMEYKVNKIPKENIVVYLNVPRDIAMDLRSKVAKKDYLKGEDKDIYEKNMEHQLKAEKMYLHLANTYKHWYKLDCMENGELQSIQKIHEHIIKVLKDTEYI